MIEKYTLCYFKLCLSLPYEGSTVIRWTQQIAVAAKLFFLCVNCTLGTYPLFQKIMLVGYGQVWVALVTDQTMLLLSLLLLFKAHDYVST